MRVVLPVREQLSPDADESTPRLVRADEEVRPELFDAPGPIAKHRVVTAVEDEVAWADRADARVAIGGEEPT